MTITSVNDGSSDKFYRAWADSADGSKGFSTTDSSKEYFGVYAGITPPSNYKAYSWTKIKGEAGRSVTNTEMEYSINDSKDAPPTTGWSLDMPVWKTGLYIWQRVKVTYSSGNPSYTTPHCIESNIIEDVTNNIGEWVFKDKTEVLSGTEIVTDKADDDAVVHVEVDGRSWQEPSVGLTNLIQNGDFREGYNGWSLVGNPQIVNGRAHLKRLEGEPLVSISYQDRTIFDNKDDIYYFAAQGEIVTFNSGTGGIMVNDSQSGLQFWTLANQPTGIVSRNSSVRSLSSNISPYIYANTNANGVEYYIDYVMVINLTKDFGAGNEPTKEQMDQLIELSGYFEGKKLVNPGNIILPKNNTPSPDYPVEIHSLNDFDVVSSVGKKNLILNSKNLGLHARTGTSERLDEFLGVKNVIKITNPTVGMYINPPQIMSESTILGESYTLSVLFTYKGNKGSMPRLYLGPGSYITAKGDIEEGKFTRIYITSENVNMDIARIHMHMDGFNEVYLADWKIEKGIANTPYSPAPEDISEDFNDTTIDKINLLLDEPLRSVGDIKDRLFRDTDGLWKVERNVGKTVFNGAETWSYQNTDKTYYSSSKNATITSSRIVSSHYVENTTTNEVGQIRFNATFSNILLNHDNGVMGIAGYVNWLKNNPVTILYTTTPTIETLEQGLQDKLNNLRSFKDSNYVYTVLPDRSNILSENLKPTLHATFKSIAWANDFRYKFEQSKAMHATDIWFAKGVSNTIAPNIGWSTDAPVWEDGLYIWSKTITTYGDGRTEETNPVCITGATGRSVDKIEEWYYLSNKSDSLEGGTWSKTPPTWTNGKYIWTKNKIIYKNPSGSEETAPINNTGGSGQKGETGTDARTVRLNNVIHAVHFDQDGLMPSVASIAFPTAVQGFSGVTPYYEFKMGNTIVRGLSTDSSWTLNTSAMKYSDFPVAVTVNVVIGGQTIATDTVTIVGTKPGEDAYTVVLANESHTFVGDVSNAMAGSTTANIIAYRGGTQVGATIGAISGLPTGMTSTVYSNGTTSARVTFTVTTSMTSPNGVVNIPVTVNGKSFTKVFNYAIAFKGAKGDKGTDGIAGKDGVGIKTTVLAYASSTSGTTVPTSGWTTTVPTVAPGNYLWTRTTWTYTDNSVENGYTVSRIGKDGNTGANGVAGKDGVGIKSTVIHYGGSTSGTSHSGVTWTTAIPSVPNGQFLWTRTTWTYDDNTTETGYSVAKMGETGAKGDKGDKGDRGSDGIAGKDGVGIKTTTLNYASSTSGTTAPTSGWTTTIPTVAAGNFLWVRTTWTYTDNSTETGYSVSRIGKDGNTGSNGIPGKDGVGVKSTVISYTASASGTTAPTSAWTSSVPSVSPGNFLWTRTVWTYTDNTTETTYSVARMGTNGATGAKGDKGNPGENATARNFLLDSKPSSIIHTAAYNIADFILAEAPVSGEIYSFVLKGELASTKTNFSIYNTDGSSPLGTLSYKGNGIYSLTFPWIYAGKERVKIYAINNSQTGSSKIEWVTMVKGSVPLTEWVPAHEDIYKYVDDVEIGGENLIDGTLIPTRYTPRNTGTDGDNYYYEKFRAPLVKDQIYTLSFNVQITNGSFNEISIYTQYGHTSTTVHPIVNGRVVATFTAAATTDAEITFIYAGVTSATRGNGMILSNLKLEKGNRATDWKPSVNDTLLDVNKKTYNPVRYIRDWSNGSTANTGNHWYELMAIDEYGNNRALGGTVTSNGTGSNFNHLTNGVTAIGTYVSAGNNGDPVYLQVDLGQIYYNIVEIKVWKYYNDGRTYYENKTEVSSDGVTWYPIYDYTVEGEYTPTEHGKSIPNTIAKTHSILTGTGTKNIIDGKADSSATEAALNEAAAKLQVLQQEVEAAATSNELNDFIDKYNKDMASRDKDARESESSLSDALASIDLINTNMGDMSETWQFIDRFIKNTPQGIVVGNDSSGSYILIKEDRLSFYSNGQEVAFISQNLMEISRGAFVEQIQIAKYQFEESTTNHLTIRYVG